jgi:hypothetical protein
MAVWEQLKAIDDEMGLHDHDSLPLRKAKTILEFQTLSNDPLARAENQKETFAPKDQERFRS